MYDHHCPGIIDTTTTNDVFPINPILTGTRNTIPYSLRGATYSTQTKERHTPLTLCNSQGDTTHPYCNNARSSRGKTRSLTPYTALRVAYPTVLQQ